MKKIIKNQYAFNSFHLVNLSTLPKDASLHYIGK